jgi:hypothetical protein
MAISTPSQSVSEPPEPIQSGVCLESPPNSRRLLVAAILTILFMSGLLIRLGGVGFDKHWDESLYLSSIQQAVRQGTVLPGRYHYPSLSFDIYYGSTAAYYWSRGSAEGAASFEEFLSQDAQSERRLIVYHRRVSAVISSLCIPAAFLVVWIGFRSAIGGLFAAGATAFGRDIVAHSRWVAPDMIGVLTVALCLAALAGFVRVRRLRYLLLAAAAAGLASATKYNLGLAVILVAATGIWIGRGRRGLAWGFGALALSVACFLIVTPGAVLEWSEFIKDVRYEAAHYRTQGDLHAPSSNRRPGWNHLTSIGDYLVHRTFSASVWFGVMTCGLALVGVAVGRSRHRPFALALFLFAAIYVLWMSSTHVFRPRNYQVPAFVLVILAGVGAAWILEQLRGQKRWTRRLGSAMVFLTLIDPAIASFKDMRGIAEYRESDSRYAIECLYWLNDRLEPGRSMWLLAVDRTLAEAFAPLSEGYPKILRAFEIFAKWDVQRPDGSAGPSAELIFSDLFGSSRELQISDDDLVVFRNPIVTFHRPDGKPIQPRAITWLEYRPGDFLAWFGTREVNYDVYPRWPTKKITVMRWGRFHELLQRALRYDPDTGKSTEYPRAELTEGP